MPRRARVYPPDSMRQSHPQEPPATPADPAEAGQSSAARNRFWRVLPLSALILAGVLIVRMGWHRALSLESLVRHREAIQVFTDRHILLAPLLYLSIYAGAVAISFPGAAVLTVIGGILFGTWLGGLSAVLGATLGATLVFLIARSAFGDSLTRQAGPFVGRFADGFRKDAFNYLLFLRLVPIFPFWLVNLAPALLNVPLSTFVAATAIGIVPGGLALAFFGSGLDSALAGQKEAFIACLQAGRTDCRLDFDLKAALTPKLFAALLVLGALALMPVVARYLRARRGG